MDTSRSIRTISNLIRRTSNENTYQDVAAVAASTILPTAFAQSVKEVRGATPYAEIKNEPAPTLIVDPPLPDLLAQGVVWIQWRVENVNIVPVFGKGHSTYLHG